MAQPAPMQSTAMRSVAWGGTIFIVSCLSAIARYVAADWSPLEAVYMVVITIFGIGYGEVRPIEDPSLRVFTIVFIVMGYSSAIFTLGALAKLVAEGEINRVLGERKMTNDIDRLRDHVVLCGYGRVGQILADELRDAGTKLVIVDASPTRIDDARESGYLVILGDATLEQTLLEAGVTRARVICSCMPDDALSVFITLTARELNPWAEIIARAEALSTKSKLLRSGATRVVLPAEIGAAKMAKLVNNPSAETLLADDVETDFFNEELEEFGLSMRELTLADGSSICGGPLSEVDFSGSRGMLVVAIRSTAGEVHACPNGATILCEGDTLVLLGHRDDLDRLGQRLGAVGAVKEETNSQTPVAT